MYIIIIVLLWLVITYDRIVIREEIIESSFINDDLTIVVLSDMHSDHSEEILRNLPHGDVFVMVGDMVDGRCDMNELDNVLRHLPKSALKLAVSGNHEFKNAPKGYTLAMVKQHFSSFDVEWLDNTVKTYEIGNNIIQFIGIEDGMNNDLSLDDKQRLKQELNESLFTVMLIHKPNRYNEFDDFRLDCMISGHAHGGQVRIPFVLNGLLAPNQGFFPKRAGGRYSIVSGVHIVSRGLCKVFYLPRIFNRREINVIKIKKNH